MYNQNAGTSNRKKQANAGPAFEGIIDREWRSDRGTQLISNRPNEVLYDSLVLFVFCVSSMSFEYSLVTL